MAAGVTTMLAGGLAACGPAASSSSSGASALGSGPAGATASTVIATASSDPLAGLSANDIAAQAWANTQDATSVHITGSGRDSSGPLTFSITLVKGKGCAGTVSDGTNNTVAVVMIGNTVWVKPSDNAWKKSPIGTDPAALAALSGKYIKVSAGSELGSGSALCHMLAAMGNSGALQSVVKGSPATVNGQPCLQLKDPGGAGYEYVSDTARPVLVRLVVPSSDGGTFDFSDYGAVTTITAPPASQTLDGKKYGL
jgi:hypothetical protein